MKYFMLFLSIGLYLSCKQSKEKSELPIEDVIEQSLDFALQKSQAMAQSLEDKPGRLPQTIDENGALVTCDSRWWVSGFFPGQLWYMYEYSNDPNILELAKSFSKRVEREQYTTDNHDVGFMIFCSYGNGYRITEEDEFLSVIEQAASSLSTRFSDTVGCIRSWDRSEWNKQWQYAVIIDNMMNLELLLWAAEKFDNPRFKEIAIRHADKTQLNHYRPDYSSFHVVSYDTLTGDVQVKNTAQGYADESSWARGQSWGLYGYTMMYRLTKDEKYLEHAKNIADFLINHPNLPADKIPYWDYNAPDIPDALRDASAGAIMCSALIELSELTEDKVYLEIAEQQLRALSGETYTSKAEANANFILQHSVGHKPANSEVDVPLSYADYYYVEALMRYRKILNKN